MYCAIPISRQQGAPPTHNCALAARAPSMSKSLEEHAGPIPEAWEGEERSYIFECRLGRAQQLKDLGNQHFKRSEWVPALARYKKALYHAHFDELQSWDLMDHHKEMLAGVAVPVKLNFVVCILKLLEAGGELDDSEVAKEDGEAETWLDRAEEVCNEVIKLDPSSAKAHYRRAQVLERRGDLAGAEACLDAAERLEGGSAGVRGARQRLREQRKAERARERALYGGLIQEDCVHRAAEEAAERREARRALALRVSSALAAPITRPAGLLLRLVLRPLYERLVSPACGLVSRLAAAAFEKALRRVVGPRGAAEEVGVAAGGEHLHSE